MFCPSVSALVFSGTVPSRRLATVELTHERACGLAGVPGGVGERVVYSLVAPTLLFAIMEAVSDQAL